MVKNETKILIEEALKNTAYNIIQLEEKKDNILQIMIEQEDFLPITVNECKKISKKILTTLEEQSSIFHTLEITSPGLDRPLTYKKDYERFIGKKAKISIQSSCSLKWFQGIIKSVKDEGVVFECKEGEALFFSWEKIKRGNLIPEIEFGKKSGEVMESTLK